MLLAVFREAEINLSKSSILFEEGLALHSGKTKPPLTPLNQLWFSFMSLKSDVLITGCAA